MLYAILLPLHSVVRWLVVLAAVAAVGLSFYGWLGKKSWTTLDERIGMLFPMILDIQVLIGILLYFFASPLTLGLLRNFQGAMRNPDVRFFGTEHSLLMVIALIVAHVGRSISRKAVDAPAKHRAAALLFGLSVLIVLAAIPWSRPLLRF